MESSENGPPLGDFEVSKSLCETVEKNTSQNSEKPKGLREVSGKILGLLGVSGIAAFIIASRQKSKSLELYKAQDKITMFHQNSIEARSIAFRALAWGTVYAVGGCSLICLILWKCLGFKNMEDFKAKVKIKNTSSNNEKLEFETFSDLIEYLEGRYGSKSEAKKVDI